MTSFVIYTRVHTRDSCLYKERPMTSVVMSTRVPTSISSLYTFREDDIGCALYTCTHICVVSVHTEFVINLLRQMTNISAVLGQTGHGVLVYRTFASV